MTQTPGKIYCVLGLEESIVKMTILHKEIYRFNAILIKLLTALFTELEQNFSVCLFENTKGSEQPILGKTNGAAGTLLPDCRVYYKATVIKTV